MKPRVWSLPIVKLIFTQISPRNLDVWAVRQRAFQDKYTVFLDIVSRGFDLIVKYGLLVDISMLYSVQEYFCV